MYNVYFAGPLFTHDQLLGNCALADAIKRCSGGEFNCLLPQDYECDGGLRAIQIRNNDLALLLKCDVALFNFNGTELDAGTVVEFMKAKEADLPAVAYRTDFRNAGDNPSDPWNLMISGYPRVEYVTLNSLIEYGKARQSDIIDVEYYLNVIANKLVEALRQVMASAPLLKPDNRDLVHKWAISSAGSNLEACCNISDMK